MLQEKLKMGTVDIFTKVSQTETRLILREDMETSVVTHMLDIANHS